MLCLKISRLLPLRYQRLRSKALQTCCGIFPVIIIFINAFCHDRLNNKPLLLCFLLSLFLKVFFLCLSFFICLFLLHFYTNELKLTFSKFVNIWRTVQLSPFVRSSSSCRLLPSTSAKILTTNLKEGQLLLIENILRHLTKFCTDFSSPSFYCHTGQQPNFFWVLDRYRVLKLNGQWSSTKNVDRWVLVCIRQ